ncbi:MAG: hypothetical protein OXQ28_02875, partial [Acidobacteriota bacterium]|nr:hypothetical protein [Acidobacteriota bacterium]
MALPVPVELGQIVVEGHQLLEEVGLAGEALILFAAHPHSRQRPLAPLRVTFHAGQGRVLLHARMAGAVEQHLALGETMIEMAFQGGADLVLPGLTIVKGPKGNRFLLPNGHLNLHL